MISFIMSLVKGECRIADDLSTHLTLESLKETLNFSDQNVNQDFLLVHGCLTQDSFLHIHESKDEGIFRSKVVDLP